MVKYVILKNIGRWSIYQPDCGRKAVPFFDTEEEAEAWLEEYLSSFGELEDKNMYCVSTMQWPEAR